MAKVLCIYGTTSGNTEIVAEKVSEILCSCGHDVTLRRAECSCAKDMRNHDLYILAASTYGHGLLQDYMIPIVREMKKMNFKGKKFTVIGLGDNKYDAEYHIESARILEKAIKSQEGEIIFTPLKISKSPMPQLKDKVTNWANQLSEILNS